MLPPRCASTYSRTRRMAAGDSPPCACGAGAIFPRVLIASRRGRACSAAFAALRQSAKGCMGGVTRAERLSRLPAITKRAAISALSLRRKSSRSRLKSAIIEQEGSARDAVCADHALVAVHRQQRARGILTRRRDRNDPMMTEIFAKEPFLYGARRSH